MPDFTITSSRNVTQRNIKIMLWGATATRKTETPLRLFPHVLLIDAEGNSDQCVDNPEIPEFLVVKTKDPRMILKVIDQVAAGKIKFADGSPVETLVIDSWTVIWSVQQEFANANAEKRAAKYNRAVEDANTTQLDWGLAKRPMKQITNRMNNSPVKFLILTAREKALYKEGADLVKIGEQPDCVKGTEYEMNLVLRLINAEGKWSYETTKVQGTLSNIFPLGKKGAKFPIGELLAYASKVKPVAVTEKGEDEIAGEQAEEANHTKEDLIAYGKEKGLDLAGIGQALKGAGFAGVDLTRWTEMIDAIDEALV